MKKILVVISGGLPIPSIKGGAVETLIDMYLDENEKKGLYSFEVYSTYADNVEEYANKYKNSIFHYVHAETFCYKISRYTRAILNKILHLNVNFAFVNEVIKDIKKNKKENYYDLVIVENNAMLVNPLAKIFKNKIILHLHNDNVNCYVKDGLKTYHNCKTIYTVSEYIKDRVETLGKENKVKVLMNGINQEQFHKSVNSITRETIRNKFGISKDDVVFIFSGRVCDDKGVYELLQAFIELRKKYDNIKLLIVGGSFFSSTKKTKYIKSLIDLTVGFENSIVFTGYIPYNQMGTIYSAADVQVVPSKFDDPCPLTVLEGMCMGLPQIVSNCSGIPEEVCTDNAIKVERGNIVVELKQAMEKLITNEKTRKKMSLASLERSKQFDNKTYVDNFFKLVAKEFNDKENHNE